MSVCPCYIVLVIKYLSNCYLNLSFIFPALHTGAGQARARPELAETPESRTVPSVPWVVGHFSSSSVCRHRGGSGWHFNNKNIFISTVKNLHQNISVWTVKNINESVL